MNPPLDPPAEHGTELPYVLRRAFTAFKAAHLAAVELDELMRCDYSAATAVEKCEEGLVLIESIARAQKIKLP